MRVQMLIFLCLLGAGLGQDRTSGILQVDPVEHELEFVNPCETQIRSNVGCYEDTVTLACPFKAYPQIKIIGAFYGRNGGWEPAYGGCPLSDFANSCSLQNDLGGHAKTVVQAICEGQGSCSISVESPNPFPPTCGTGYRNHLLVRWQCCSEHAFSGCQKKVLKKVDHYVSTGWMNECRSLHPLYVATCEGPCPSSESPYFPGLTNSQKCQCCRARNKSYYDLRVHCAPSNQNPTGGIKDFYSVENIDDCFCENCP